MNEHIPLVFSSGTPASDVGVFEEGHDCLAAAMWAQSLRFLALTLQMIFDTLWHHFVAAALWALFLHSLAAKLHMLRNLREF